MEGVWAGPGVLPACRGQESCHPRREATRFGEPSGSVTPPPLRPRVLQLPVRPPARLRALFMHRLVTSVPTRTPRLSRSPSLTPRGNRARVLQRTWAVGRPPSPEALQPCGSRVQTVRPQGGQHPPRSPHSRGARRRHPADAPSLPFLFFPSVAAMCRGRGWRVRMLLLRGLLVFAGGCRAPRTLGRGRGPVLLRGTAEGTKQEAGPGRLGAVRGGCCAGRPVSRESGGSTHACRTQRLS